MTRPPAKRKIVIDPNVVRTNQNAVRAKRTRKQVNQNRISLLAAAERNEFFDSALSNESTYVISQPAGDSHTNSISNSTPDGPVAIELDNATVNDIAMPAQNDSDSEVISIGTDEKSALTQSEIIVAKLDEILRRIEAIEKSEAKTEVRLRNIENFIERFDGANCSVGIDAISRFHLGLPVTSLDGLNQLEADLAVEPKKQQYVSFEFKTNHKLSSDKLMLV